MNTVAASVSPHAGLLVAEAGNPAARASDLRALAGKPPAAVDVLRSATLARPVLPRAVRAALAARARRRTAARGYAQAATVKSTAGKATAGKSTAGKATAGKAASTSASSAAARTDPSLAFLKDPKLSIEDKLMRLVAALDAQYEAEMQQKLDALAGGTGASSGTSGSTSGKKGFLAGLGDAVKSFFPAAGIAFDLLKSKPVQTVLKKIGGPVLAAGASALGFPALAPALLEYGPQVVDAAAGAAKALDGAGSSSRSTAPSGAGAGSDGDRQLQIMQLQRVQEKQKEMFQLVSNILRSMHDTRFGIVSNIR